MQHGIRPPRVHEIDALIALVRNAGYDFPPFADEAGLLNPYAVTVRYPEQAPIPNEAEGRAAVRAAQQIIDAAKALLSV